jgi:DNA polymerase-3 subunit alpha
VLSLCSDILNHNKAAEAKNAALIENGEEYGVPMKPIVGVNFCM